MPVVLIGSDFWKKLIALVCVFSFTAMAQQGNTTLSVLPQAQSGTSGTPATTQQKPAAAPDSNMASAPQPRSLPKVTGVDYSKPAPLLPNPFARYMPREVPPPAFTNAPKLEDLIKNGKLVLSLDDAIAIAVADNLDIAVARYNLPIADTDILRTKSGGSPLGVRRERARVGRLRGGRVGRRLIAHLRHGP